MLAEVVQYLESDQLQQLSSVISHWYYKESAAVRPVIIHVVLKMLKVPDLTANQFISMFYVSLYMSMINYILRVV